ncbi:hypothetical protein [Thermogemmatispora sp.]|uniref:hypothetical protein n=1 Tax=Thermogemmatispora sp. TaxID=1968838 RepID=UPI002ACC0E90|nr:hypothetical protein [Thermogemmatispora sp.]
MSEPFQQREQSSVGPGESTETEEIAFEPLVTPHAARSHLVAWANGRRLLRVAVWCGVLLSALLLWQLFPVGEVAQQLLRLSTAEQSTGANSAAYYLSVDLPWTRITVDGQPLSQRSVLAFASPLQLLRGSHLISWQAAPFREQSCTISVPPSPQDTCLTSSALLHNREQIQVLWLRDRLSDLPFSAQQALLAALRAAWQPVAWSTTLEPGERYIDLNQTGYVGVVRPGQSLRAILRAELVLDLSGRHTSYLACQTGTPDGETGDCPIREENCLQLCTLPAWQWQPSPVSADASPNDWHVVALATVSWDIVRQDGQPLALGQPLGLYSFAPEALPLAFTVRWTGSQWQARLLTGPALSSTLWLDGKQVTLDPACVDAQHSFPSFDQTLVGSVQRVHFFSSVNPAEGCLMTFKVKGETAAFLERGGLLLAVNAVAQRLQPYWPVANAPEQALAARLSRLPGWDWWLWQPQ